MDGELSQWETQSSGIRQGCTCSPFLFVLVLTAIMADVQALVKEARLLSGGPAPGRHRRRVRRRHNTFRQERLRGSAHAEPPGGRGRRVRTQDEQGEDEPLGFFTPGR
eukprot:9099471-Alexandrium_andersonii.AAC.1